MFDTDSKINKCLEKKDLHLYAECCRETLYAPQGGYHGFVSRARPSFVKAFLRGATAIGICAKTDASVYAPILEDDAAIADDWFMIGNDLRSAIIAFDSAYQHGRFTACEPESKPTTRTTSKSR